MTTFKMNTKYKELKERFHGNNLIREFLCFKLTE